MASVQEEDLTCPVCCDIYKEPVILTCGHSFCKNCLQDVWNEKEEKNCPVCRRRSSRSDPPISFALKSLCLAVKQKPRKTSEGSEALCRLHNEKLKLFCEDDQLPICVVCQTSKKHKTHQCCPIDEAAEDHKGEVQTKLKPLHEKLKVYNDVKENCDQTAKYLKIQADHTVGEIKNQFKKLHEFLQEEEEARIAALREEEERKSAMMKKKIEGLSREISTLSDTIRSVEEELKAEDISFLQNYMNTMERAQCTLPDPQLDSGALIDVAKHLGNLSFRVWEKMKERFTFTPVILDPNTASPWLSLSDDLTSVRNMDTKKELPYNPERHTQYTTVLGSVGFSSGTHSWEVEVGDHPDWTIGVAKESVDRKGKVLAIPKNGIWVMLHRRGKYTVESGKSITVKKELQRIRVQLDYDRGEVSFYQPEDRTPIYTYRDTFTEKLLPYFCIGKAYDAKHPDTNICHQEVSIITQSSQ